MTYTHTKGLRNDYADFSYGILDVNKAAGLLVKLDENGNPKVTGSDDLSGKKVVDVGGWAPTADGLDYVENKCTGHNYALDYKLVMATGAANNNDLALSMLLNGTVDAMFVYSDQAKNYKKACAKGPSTTINCDLWKGFGTKFAYVQTGQFGYVNNGTTLALAKKGSGVAAKLNPCLQKFMETKDYYDICVKYDFVDSCYRNSFFPVSDDIEVHDYNKPTKEHDGDCSTGYCPCTGVTKLELAQDIDHPIAALQADEQKFQARAVVEEHARGQKLKLKLAQDINYPPYAYKNTSTGEVAGFGHDIAVGMSATCADLEIEVVETRWSDCWTPTGLMAPRWHQGTIAPRALKKNKKQNWKNVQK